MSLQKFIGVFLTVLLIGVLLSFVLSWPIMVLWNSCLVPAVQGINEIDWMQAWGLSLLSGFLFRSHAGTKD
jgi:uncharacterized membrane protein